MPRVCLKSEKTYNNYNCWNAFPYALCVASWVVTPVECYLAIVRTTGVQYSFPNCHFPVEEGYRTNNWWTETVWLYNVYAGGKRKRIQRIASYLIVWSLFGQMLAHEIWLKLIGVLSSQYKTNNFISSTAYFCNVNSAFSSVMQGILDHMLLILVMEQKLSIVIIQRPPECCVPPTNHIPNKAGFW